MEIKIIHQFLKICYNMDELMDGTESCKEYYKRLRKQSVMFPNRFDPNMYNGMGFEFLCNGLVLMSPIYPRQIGCKDFKPVELGNDTGVDGVGIGPNLLPRTYQFKFKSNPMELLTANKDRLSNFVVASQNKYGVPIDCKDNMVVITNAAGLNHFTKIEMLYEKVSVINGEQLELLCDTLLFWDQFKSLIRESNENFN